MYPNTFRRPCRIQARARGPPQCLLAAEAGRIGAAPALAYPTDCRPDDDQGRLPGTSPASASVRVHVSGVPWCTLNNPSKIGNSSSASRQPPLVNNLAAAFSSSHSNGHIARLSLCPPKEHGRPGYLITHSRKREPALPSQYVVQRPYVDLVAKRGEG